MIYIDKTILLEDVTSNEAYNLVNEKWVKTLIVSFPKESYTTEQATAYFETAKTVRTYLEDNKFVIYYLDGTLKVEESETTIDVWFYNPSVYVSENLQPKVNELQKVIDTLLGGEADA